MAKNRFPHSFVDLEEITSSESEGVRMYEVPGGKKYPSVTTILGKVTDKSGIDAWRERVGHEEADRVSDKAKRDGTRFHSIAEAYLRNEANYPRDTRVTDILLFQDVKKTLDQHVSLVYGIECPLYSHYLQTAGRADGVVEYDGRPTVIDFKTSSGMKSEDQILHYFAQSTCYAMMFRELTGIKVKDIAIIMANRNDVLQIFRKPISLYTEYVKNVFVTHRGRLGI